MAYSLDSSDGAIKRIRRRWRWKPWTSDACYETTDLNYEYDILQTKDGETDEEL